MSPCTEYLGFAFALCCVVLCCVVDLESCILSCPSISVGEHRAVDIMFSLGVLERVMYLMRA